MNPELQVIDGGQGPTKERQTDPDELKLSIDLDSEAAILSSIIHDESLLDIVRSWLRPEHFYSEAHRRMYEALCEVRDACKPIDVVTLSTQLRDSDRMVQAGGMAYVTTILNAAPALSSSRLKAYALSVRDKWVRRETKSIGLSANVRAKTEAAPIDKILGEVRASIDELTIEMGLSEKNATATEVLKRTAERLGNMRNTEGKGELPTGFDRFDRLVGGLTPMLMVVAARPGMGKTCWATAVSVNVANRADEAGERRNGVYFASQETLDVEAMTRLWCAEARVSVTRARTGMLGGEDWRKLTAAAELINGLPLWIDDEPAQSVTGLWGKCRCADALLRNSGKKLKLVVVDYLQLMKAPRPKMSREEVVSENARTCLAMANDLQCCVMALAQLNRECEKRPNKRPQLADLRESGEIEQASRCVVFIYRDEYYNKQSEDRNVAELIVAKQNNGPTDTVKIRFDGECTRFDNLAEGYDDEGDAPPPINSRAAVRKEPEPPPGFFDDPEPAPPAASQTSMLPDKEVGPPKPAQRIVKYVYEAATPGITLAQLREVLGKTKRMSVSTVERGVRAAVEQGLILVDGETLRRLK